VSEETGAISFAKGGKLVRDLNGEKVRDLLRAALKRVIKDRRLLMPLK